jgi:hypothetical protein
LEGLSPIPFLHELLRGRLPWAAQPEALELHVSTEAGAVLALQPEALAAVVLGDSDAVSAPFPPFFAWLSAVRVRMGALRFLKHRSIDTVLLRDAENAPSMGTAG